MSYQILKRKTLISIVGAVIVFSLVYIASNFDLSALQRPSKAETFLATKAKHWLVASAVRREKLAPETPEPSSVSLSVARGISLFQACCSTCLDQLGATRADGKVQGMPAGSGGI
jgi:hypothetical protein